MTTRFTRRRFLALGGLAVLALGAGAAWRWRKEVRRWVLTAPPDPAPTGPLSARALAVLTAVVPALLGDPIDPGHYVEGFRWRAEHLPGHRAMTERFVRHLDDRARALGRAGYEELPRASQRRLLVGLRPVRGWRRAVHGLLERGRAQDSENVMRALLSHFAATDAWVRIGYEAWPGVPRAIAVPGGAGV